MQSHWVPSRFVATIPLVALVAVAACGGIFDPDVPLAREEAMLAAGNCLNLVAESGVSGGGPAGYTKCADENGTCTFTQPVDVAYGAKGSYLYRDGVTGSITFNSTTFNGDPSPNVAKSGYYRSAGGPAGYTKCGDEGSTCSFSRSVDVAFGAHGLFNYKCGVTGNIVASTDNFGDPIFGSVKAAYYRNSGGPAGYTWCADENGTCKLSATSDVAYGANGSFFYKSGVSGTITADNATFGDPISNVPKSAYYRVSVPRNGPAGFTWCADERGTCSFTQPVDVAYGVNGSFAYKYGFSGTVRFDNPDFGDPAPNQTKAGYYRAASAGTGDWSAQWIWLPQDRPNNTWMRLRKKVTLSQKPTSASVRLAAENKYWLYINGQLVVPDGGLDLRPDLTNTYYDALDIAPYLNAGDNVIAALVWYKGGLEGYSQKMTSDGGFLFEAALTGATPAKIVSDGTWKVAKHPSFARTGQQQQWQDIKWVEYPVVYDARNEPGDWTALSYDDRVWSSATPRGTPPSAPWNTLVHRTIPMLKNSGLTPYTNQASLPTSLSSNTTFTADVGNNLQVNAYLKVNAPAGVTITLRMNKYYQEQYVTRAGVQEYTTYQWQNTNGQLWSKHSVEYSFTNVTGPVQILELKYRPLGYNTEPIGSFSSSNPRLNTLWAKSRNTSYVCMRDQFYDCPDRERGQWWGDVAEQILYSFYLYDDRAALLAKKGFRELFNTQKADGSLYTTAPGTLFHLPDQNMAAVDALGLYYLYTGDRVLVAELYPKVATFIKQYVATARNSDGLLVLRSGVWNWIDWGSNLDVQTGSANTVANGLFVRLLETGKLLAQATGNSSDVSYYQSLQDAVRARFNQYFWSSGSNAYVFGLLNGVQSRTIDDRSSAWAILAGTADASRLPGVLQVLKTKVNASPYQERFIEEAMFQAGSDTDAINRMLSYYQPDIDSWSQTMWERMGSSEDTNNHAWAASPAYLLGAFVAGVRPTAPGWTSYQVTPLLGTLTSVSATVPSPRGSITVAHTQSAGGYVLNLTSPAGTQALVGIPRKQPWTSVSVNGVTVWRQGQFVDGAAGVSQAGADSAYIKFNVTPGTWRFVAQ
ncbi:Bacterial alpha-L-rhamnosidase [Cystobacter fuscus]|uniref:alpha-L-rhamnosidase-related protein n=1 Tax=Cystobacter fuscus TaxID=43 RepID=UPI002B2AA3EC|nr:Bacterial alpha-L-rhamnosidase [Cystobacter fuscus]